MGQQEEKTPPLAEEEAFILDLEAFLSLSQSELEFQIMRLV